MKTIEGDYIPIDQPRFMEGEMMQASDEKISYNIAHIIIDGTEDSLVPLDEVYLSVTQINQHLEMIKRQEALKYVEHQEQKIIKQVSLETIYTEDPKIIIQVHEEAMLNKMQYPNSQVIHFVSSKQESFTACVIPISHTEEPSNIPLSAVLIQPLESTIPEIRKLWVELNENRKQKTERKGIESIPFVNHRDLPRKKKPNT